MSTNRMTVSPTAMRAGPRDRTLSGSMDQAVPMHHPACAPLQSQHNFLFNPQLRLVMLSVGLRGHQSCSGRPLAAGLSRPTTTGRGRGQ